MTKLGKRLMAAAKEAGTIARGEADPKTYVAHVPEKVDVQAIRKDLKLSQSEFSITYHIPAATVRDWEQNRREPDTATRAYLTVIKRNPDLVAKTLSFSLEVTPPATHKGKKQRFLDAAQKFMEAEGKWVRKSIGADVVRNSSHGPASKTKAKRAKA